METLAFIHTAIAHEDPNPDAELVAFENINLKVSTHLAMGVVAAGVATATLSHADQAKATIYYGEQGPGVATLQRALGSSADGVFGPQTYNDVVYFQRVSGLQVDGVAGPKTLAALGLSTTLTSGGSSGDNGGPVPVSGSATVVASSGLLIRSSPGGYVIGGLGYGDTVSLTGNESGGWVELAGGGWVSSYYLDYGGSADVGAGAYISAGSGVNVRSGPSIYSEVAYGLGYGASVALTGATEYRDGYTWSELSDGNWVASQYISYR